MSTKEIIICIISFFMLVYTLDRGITMGTILSKESIIEIGIDNLFCHTDMGNKIYLLKNGQKYKKFCSDYGDLRKSVNRNFKADLVEQTEEYGHHLICFPQAVVSSDKWLSGMITDFVNGEKLKRIELTSQIDYLLHIIELLEKGIVDVSFRGWVLEDLHEENILIDLSNHKSPVHIIDTDFYSKNDTQDQILLLQTYKDNLVRIFDAIMITILPQFDSSQIWSEPKIKEAYMKATSGEITCSEFLKTLLVTLKFSQQKEQNILTLRKSTNQL